MKYHPDIEAAAAEILAEDTENGPKASFVISTTIMVVCSLLSLALQCYRWRMGNKAATDAEVADQLKTDMNRPPNYNPETDTFDPKLVRQMEHQAKRAARQNGERMQALEAHTLAIRALRKAQKGSAAAALASLPPYPGDEE